MRSRRVTILILAGCSLFLSLIGGEIVLRRIEPPFFSWPIQCYHPSLGWTGWPDQLHYHDVDGRLVRYPTNPLGFRDQIHTTQAPPGVHQIVLVGDSFVEAAQIELEESFFSQLRRILCHASTEYWDVVALGMGDWGPVQELIALRETGIDYRPDLIIVQVFPLNDIINCSFAGAYLGSANDTYRPYLDPEDGFRTITHLNPIMTWLRQRSYLCRYGLLLASRHVSSFGDERYFRTWQEQEAYASDWCVRSDLPGDINCVINLNTFAPPDQQLEVIREGWAATEQALREIHRTARECDAKLLILVIPHQHELSYNLDTWRQRLPFAIDPASSHERLRNLFAGTDVEVVSLLPTFNDHTREVVPYLQGHLNPAAHRIVAETLAARVAVLFPDSFPYYGTLMSDDFESGEITGWSVSVQ
jgi:hypothetical protein